MATAQRLGAHGTLESNSYDSTSHGPDSHDTQRERIALMKYQNGRTIRLGNKVKLGLDEGVVVFSIDTDEYSVEFPQAEWCYLARGIMVRFPQLGLVHFEFDSPDLAPI
ncbi:hypothetical protein LP420_22335 [Massilia sp. B-10]|nr:hypothetical protein LP420_22335 [Massilia sp. B-10]UUZ52245.1 hypothetical protein LP419_21800 [Massilia sp. H-1]